MAENNSENEYVKDNWTPPTLNLENFRESSRWYERTHFFLEWNKEGNSISPCFKINPMEHETVIKGIKNTDFYKLEIFGFDLKNRNEKRFNLLINMKNAFVHFFKEVIEIGAAEKEKYLRTR